MLVTATLWFWQSWGVSLTTFSCFPDFPLFISPMVGYTVKKDHVKLSTVRLVWYVLFTLFGMLCSCSNVELSLQKNVDKWVTHSIRKYCFCNVNSHMWTSVINSLWLEKKDVGKHIFPLHFGLLFRFNNLNLMMRVGKVVFVLFRVLLCTKNLLTITLKNESHRKDCPWSAWNTSSLV